MAGERKRIGLREVRSLELGQVVWDAAVVGFGVRRQKGPAAVYFVKYRTSEGRQRWQVIGRHGAPWTPEQARDKALSILGDVADGADPAAQKNEVRKAVTVGELCDQYLAEAEAGRVLTRGRPKKASTLATDRGRIERHIKPLLGRLAVAAVDRGDVETFMHKVAAGETAARIKTGRYGLARVSGGKGTATRTVGLVGAIFTFAIRQRLRSDNPAFGIERYAGGQRERRISPEEYAVLGEALRVAKAQQKIWPHALAMARFLALTGWRTGEALALNWPDVDLVRRTARLPDTKTGASTRALSHAACDVLKELPRLPGGRVFPATRGDGQMVGFKKFWPKITKLAELPTDITPHVLRHSLASEAADLEYSEATIAALIGHRGHSVTRRYVHSADAVLLAAADAVANHISELMGERRQPADVVPLRA